MTKEIKLEVKSRKEEGKKVRQRDMVPAILYGQDIKESISLEVSKKAFKKVFAEAGEYHLIDLDIDGKEKAKVLIKEVQISPVKSEILHADFYKVNMKEKITTEIPLHFIGESRAVKELGGTLVKTFDHLEVECLPTSLIDFIEVDLAPLAEFGDAIRVKDLNLPEGVEALPEAEEIIAMVSEAKVEVEAAPAEVPAEAADAKKAEPVEKEAGKKEVKK